LTDADRCKADNGFLTPLAGPDADNDAAAEAAEADV
jgi:hypothetical protein